MVALNDDVLFVFEEWIMHESCYSNFHPTFRTSLHRKACCIVLSFEWYLCVNEKEGPWLRRPVRRKCSQDELLQKMVLANFKVSHWKLIWVKVFNKENDVELGRINRQWEEYTPEECSHLSTASYCIITT